MTESQAGVGPSAEPRSAMEVRQAQLAAAVATLRRRASIGTDRVLLISGAVLIPLGVVIILLGLIVVGGFCYFGYWLTRQVVEGRAQADRLADSLARIERLLLAGGDIGRGPARLDVEDAERVAPSRARARTPGAPSPNGMLVATMTGTMLHRPDCPVVANKPKSELRAVDADDPDLKPCKICDPLEVPVP